MTHKPISRYEMTLISTIRTLECSNAPKSSEAAIMPIENIMAAKYLIMPEELTYRMRENTLVAIIPANVMKDR